MKKRRMKLFGIVMAVILVVGGCGTKKTEVKTEKAFGTGIESSANPAETKEGTDEAQVKADIPMVDLPEGIKGVKAETAANGELRDLIVEDMEIPEDYLETTHYYYNYVDLNDDGEDEIFAIVTGPYTSGTGGSTAIWVSKQAGKLHIQEDFTIVNTPIIISDKIENGYHELIVPYYGNSKDQYSVLSYQDGEYINVPDGKIIDSLQGITGKAIIANDFIKESEAGIKGFNLMAE
ncbi:hypothetical protein [Anaerocolumna xylanovorans]|uniref:Lipoprotein n=1 Tax=Anaerocolumna xylanovorans DSM 12503 TaxID=1121345 RepID=A0A1M7XW64_9FIRM|nr:hypothetical protein [Anaerocolumna xylanovorans]SHO42971.1 hypothetical protein SAMN02745217_00043 [Anaerocolumna xylanovorans DSM 12503]